MPESKDFTSIRVCTLRGDIKTPFNVYIQAGNKHILYCRSGDSFAGDRLKRLAAKKLKHLYIRPDDLKRYEEYVARSIEQAYDPSSGRSLEVRAEVIQGFQQAKAQDLMTEPQSQSTYNFVRASVHRFVDFLAKEAMSVNALLRQENMDASISHHSVNVATLSTALALKSYGPDSPLLQSLSLGCLIHDIDHFHSKFNVERSPKQMESDGDFAVYKAHPLNGAQRFQGAMFLDPLVLKIISQHEEHMDGSGFPQGLKGSEMDPLIMIAATANAYDRLVSFDRMEPKAALKHLLIDKMGAFPLENLQALQAILKEQGVV